jgi:general secretion pathway protein H
MIKTYSPKKYRGFTLIELLVVILIISILTGLVFYKFSSESFQGRAIDSESHLLVRLCSNLRNIALLENSAYGLSIAEDGYFWWKLDYNQAQWKVLKKSPFSYHKIGDKNYELKLVIDTEKNNNNDPNSPHIIFYPDSTITPFKCVFSQEENVSVIVSTNGVSDVQIEQQ